jgi:hypothetical protein
MPLTVTTNAVGAAAAVTVRQPPGGAALAQDAPPAPTQGEAL